MDDPKILLDEIDADADYLFGRVAANGSEAPAMSSALRLKIRKIKFLLDRNWIAPEEADEIMRHNANG